MKASYILCWLGGWISFLINAKLLTIWNQVYIYPNIKIYSLPILLTGVITLLITTLFIYQGNINHIKSLIIMFLGFLNVYSIYWGINFNQIHLIYGLILSVLLLLVSGGLILRSIIH